MALAQIKPIIQNEYPMVPLGAPSPMDFDAVAPDLNSAPAKKLSVADRLWRRLRQMSRGRLALLIGLLLLGGLVLVSTLTALLGQTSTQQLSMSPAMERYWRTVDIVQIQKDLKGWSREDMSRLFLTVREQTSDPETRRHIDSLGKMLRLPGFESSSSLLSALVSQPIFLLGIFLSIGIWGAAVVISIAPYVRWQRAPALVPDAAPAVPLEQSGDAILEELLPEITLEAAVPEPAEKKEEEKKPEEQPASEQSEEASSGLGDLASLFEEEDTSITALEQFCKNLAEIVIDDLSTKAKDVARDLRAFVAQSAPRPKPG
ncbi:MAG: hypothetical protein AB1817_07650 [Chloroflexota bacterium]